MPVAVNCFVLPFADVGDAGVTAMETSSAASTVRVVLPVTEPEVAEMTLVPIAAVVARPLVPVVLLIVAVAIVAEAQVTELVIS